MPSPVCPTPDKVRFGSLESARAAAANAGEGKFLTAQVCRCGWWHLWPAVTPRPP